MTTPSFPTSRASRITWRHGLQGRRTAEGITALQMDIKITGVTLEIPQGSPSIRPTQRPAVHSRQDGPRRSNGPREQLSQFAAEDNLDQRSTPRRSAP